MRNLPLAVHTAAQVRAMDAHAIERQGIPSYTLMTRAGSAALRVLCERWPRAKRITVVCGVGNNAGDGYVVARLARQAGLKVTVIALFDPADLRGDALQAWQDFSAAGGQAIEWLDSTITQADVIVDAIFGTGLSRALDDRLQGHVHAMNVAAAPILALDVPSGLDATGGQVLGAAIEADCTIAFVGLKLGFYVGQGPDHVGALAFDGLETPPLDELVGIAAERIDPNWMASILPPRSRLAHKGSHGHVLIVGGGRSMAGAVRLAGEASLRVGAGLVTVATHPDNVAAVVGGRPELIVRGVQHAVDLDELIERADVVAVGPGLGQDDWARALCERVLRSGKPVVADADALNLIAAHPQLASLRTANAKVNQAKVKQANVNQFNANWVITPHPGEAGRLLASDSRSVQDDRIAAATRLAQDYQAIVVLKGANSLVVAPDAVPAICDRGNPGMAAPGMGDVLTGVIAGLHAQLRDLYAAAKAGVYAHALAGDLAVAFRSAALASRAGVNIERGLMASDLFAQLPLCVNVPQTDPADIGWSR